MGSSKREILWESYANESSKGEFHGRYSPIGA